MLQKTKWNDIIVSFSTQMPVRKHWRNLRTYSNCFTGSDAVDWMLRFLKSSPHFKHLTITRHNAVAVLQIMHKDRLFEDVRTPVSAAPPTSSSSAVTNAGLVSSSSAADAYSAKPFVDDDHLYRLALVLALNQSYRSYYGI